MPLSVTDIRQLNIARLFHALRQKPGSSQRELVEATGIDQATVSVIVNQLEGLGVLERSTRPNQGRVGRPESALRISRRAGVLAGVSLEPDSIDLVVTALDGEELTRARLAGSRDVSRALEIVLDAVERSVTDLGFPLDRVHGLGIGVPAITAEDGTVLLAPNLGWRNVGVLRRLAALTDIPTYIDNDSNAATMAEKLFGQRREARDFLSLSGHSGVGGGLFLDGELYRGSRGFAGEVGHLKVVQGGRACGCGGHGCLETYVSGLAILRQLEERGSPVADLGAVSAGAAEGDAVVLEVLHEAAEHLGLVLANLVNLLDPELVVFSGSLVILLDHCCEVLHEQLERHALPGFDVELLASPLGEVAVPLGGVALALEGMFRLMTGTGDRFRVVKGIVP